MENEYKLIKALDDCEEALDDFKYSMALFLDAFRRVIQEEHEKSNKS